MTRDSSLRQQRQGSNYTPTASSTSAVGTPATPSTPTTTRTADEPWTPYKPGSFKDARPAKKDLTPDSTTLITCATLMFKIDVLVLGCFLDDHEEIAKAKSAFLRALDSFASTDLPAGQFATRRARFNGDPTYQIAMVKMVSPDPTSCIRD